MSRARDLADLSNVINKGANLQPNLIINGDMAVSQRGNSTGVTGVGYYGPDRYRFTVGSAGAGTFSIDQDSNAPEGFASSFKLSCTTADASPNSTDAVFIAQRLEGQNLQAFKKGNAGALSATLSFYVKSNKTGTYQVNFYDLDNTRIIGSSYTINAADTWEYKTITYSPDTTGSFTNDNNLSAQIEWALVAGTSYNSGAVPTDWEAATNADRAAALNVNIADSTSNYWQLTGVSLVVGDSAPVTHPYESYAENLERCNRYYYSLKAIASYSNFLQAAWRTTSQARGIIPFPVTMRASPSLSTTGAFVSLGNGTFSSFSIPDGGLKDQGTLNVVGSGGTIGYSTTIRANNDSTASINFDAEL
jgi:hypothetical protein